jgi:hypothetical protein
MSSFVEETTHAPDNLRPYELLASHKDGKMRKKRDSFLFSRVE